MWFFCLLNLPFFYGLCFLYPLLCVFNLQSFVSSQSYVFNVFCLKSSSTFFCVFNLLSLMSFVFYILSPLFCGFNLLIRPSSMVSVFKFYVLCVMVKAFVFIGILLYLVHALIIFWKSLRYVTLRLENGTKDEFPK